MADPILVLLICPAPPAVLGGADAAESKDCIGGRDG
jgi:hypothetical protein